MPPQITQQDIELLQRLEEDLWREETRFDTPYMEKLLTEDFFEIGRSGSIYSREATLSHPKQPINAVLPLPDLNVRLLTEKIAQVTYNSAVTSEGAPQFHLVAHVSRVGFAVSSRYTLSRCGLTTRFCKAIQNTIVML